MSSWFLMMSFTAVLLTLCVRESNGITAPSLCLDRRRISEHRRGLVVTIGVSALRSSVNYFFRFSIFKKEMCRDLTGGDNTADFLLI